MAPGRRNECEPFSFHIVVYAKLQRKEEYQARSLVTMFSECVAAYAR